MWNDRLDTYDVLVLPRDHFRSSVKFPDGFSLECKPSREAERDLLVAEFPQWEIPYGRAFPGGREDSIAGIRYQDRTVGLLYLGESNELGLVQYGQIHYAVISQEFRGKGLYAPLFMSLLRRAEDWNLAGVLLVPDREGLGQLYEQWGAVRVGALSRMNRRRRLFRIFFDPHRSLRRKAREIIKQTERDQASGDAT